MTPQSLVNAYLSWEQQPGNEERAKRLESEMQVVAEDLGTTATWLRIYVVQERRAGLPPAEAIKAAIAKLR